MKITEIEAIALRLPYEERIRRQYYHFAMREEHTVYKFHTDTGLVGLGENPGAPFGQEMLDPFSALTPSTTSCPRDSSTSIWPVTTSWANTWACQPGR